MSAAGRITSGSRPEVSTATCRLRPLSFFAASQPRGPPFPSSSRSGCRSRPRSGSARGPPARACTRTPSARAGSSGVAADGAAGSRFARGRTGRPAAAACRSGAAAAGLGRRDQGASRPYCPSPSPCPAPKSPTKARFSAVHRACLQKGLLPSLNRRHRHYAPSSLSTPPASHTASEPLGACRSVIDLGRPVHPFWDRLVRRGVVLPYRAADRRVLLGGRVRAALACRANLPTIRLPSPNSGRRTIRDYHTNPRPEGRRTGRRSAGHNKDRAHSNKGRPASSSSDRHGHNRHNTDRSVRGCGTAHIARVGLRRVTRRGERLGCNGDGRGGLDR